jgi:hypothetical protein
MTAIERIMKFAGKRQIEIRNKAKEKSKAADISNAAKQKELLLKIATDLGYVEK